MSVENDGIPLSWEEIKAASRRFFGRESIDEHEAEMRSAREYLAQNDCEDARAKEHIAIPGYN